MPNDSNKLWQSILGVLLIIFAGYVTLTTDRTEWFIIIMFIFGGFLVSKTMILDFLKSVSKYLPWPEKDE